MNFRFLQLLRLANIIFLILDVCLPVWDIITDIQVTCNYWNRSNFTWVSHNFDWVNGEVFREVQSLLYIGSWWHVCLILSEKIFKETLLSTFSYFNKHKQEEQVMKKIDNYYKFCKLWLELCWNYYKSCIQLPIVLNNSLI